MSKAKVSLAPEMDVDTILKKIEKKYQVKQPITIDGVKIEFENSWVHLRKSNTEAIIRVYTEAPSEKEANTLAESFLEEIKAIS